MEQYSTQIANGVKQYTPKANTEIEKAVPGQPYDDMMPPYNQVVIDIPQKGSISQ